MAESKIPVDLRNPGQVFACLGIVEAADICLGDAAGVFDWSDESKTTFRVTASGSEAPVARVLRFLEEAEIIPYAPVTFALEAWKDSWGDQPRQDPIGSPFPFPKPSSPATLPVVLCDDQDNEVAIDHWGDGTKRDNVKFWAGSGGYPGAALLRDAIGLAKGKMNQHSGDPFALREAQKSSFRFDWRRDYIPLDAGFSPNQHTSVQMVGFPVVEVLAAIGVSHARPKRTHKLEYRYGVLGGATPLDPIFLRAALGAETSPMPDAPFRCFVMYLGYPGKEGDARCITHVKEENSNDATVN